MYRLKVLWMDSFFLSFIICYIGIIHLTILICQQDALLISKVLAGLIYLIGFISFLLNLSMCLSIKKDDDTLSKKP
jgi:hypothetical protein